MELPHGCCVFHFLSFINYLFCALCWVYCTSQPSSNVPFFKKHNICFFWWRLHKSESFISRQHTSSKTPGRILLFLSNHFLSIFWCQDPSWLTSAGSIWVPYRPVFPVFCHDTWLISVVFSVYVEGEDFCSDMRHLAQGSHWAVPMVAVHLLNVFVLYFDRGFYACRPQHCDDTFETPAYSLWKKNGVLRKCEVSGMSLIH